jgi:hypothetical protein
MFTPFHSIYHSSRITSPPPSPSRARLARYSYLYSNHAFATLPYPLLSDPTCKKPLFSVNKVRVHLLLLSLLFYDIWVVKTGFCLRDVGQTNEQQCPLQRVANQWVELGGGRFHSNQLTTTFYLPAIKWMVVVDFRDPLRRDRKKYFAALMRLSDNSTS